LRSRGNIFIIVLVLALLAGTAALAFQKDPILGLDLRGGSEVVLKAIPDRGVTLTPAMMNQAKNVYEKRVNALGTAEPSIVVETPDKIVIQLPGDKHPDRLNGLIGSAGTLYFIDLQNGLTPGVSRSVVSGGQIAAKNSLYELLKGTQTLADGKFSTYFVFDKNKKNEQLLATGVKTTQQVLDTLNITSLPANYEQLGVPAGKIAVSCTVTKDRACPGVTDKAPVKGDGKTYWYMFDLPSADRLLTGKQLEDARPDIDTTTGQPIVKMTFSDSGGKIFKKITGDLAREGKAAYDLAGGASSGLSPVQFARQFAVILDNKLETYPYIDFQSNPDGIGKDSQITGVSSTESKDIATVLSSGSLPVEFIRLSQTSVSATLGKTSLNQGLFAGLLGLGAVMVWMIFYYRFLGLIADLALIIYAVLYFGVILAADVTLTLPGIAGLILTIGVAADANVVVFERIKEEVRAGKTVRSAIAGGYTKGFRTIIDANVVTLITAAVLFVASQSSVRGFALLLALGVLVSMFTAVAATRAMLGVLGGFKWFNNAAFMGATAKPIRWRYDFGGRMKLWFLISGAVIAIGLGTVAVRGLNKGLDFTGGTRVSFSLNGGKTATVDQVRSAVVGVAPVLNDAVIRGTGNASGDRYSNFQVESKELKGAEESALKTTIVKTFGPSVVDRAKISTSSVSASFGSEILQGAVLAFVFSIVLIVVYLAFRFDWRYSLPTIAALLHDLLVTIGVYAVTGRVVTSATVAAVLTILGYSLYDTIIVFDRVRENERLLRKHSITQIVNISLWETMTRSLNTSFITLLPLLSLFLFGGDTLKDFAFALLIGIVSGAYSSFFIASPLLVLLKRREPEYQRRAGSDDLPAIFLRGNEPKPLPSGGAPTPAPTPAAVGSGAPAATVDDATRAARQRRLDRRGK
jgi:SecD/SecF fusion protein